jgi:hypothetical protein
MTDPGPQRTSDDSDATADSIRLTVFLSGLTIGALVGAAIAGSAIWERARHRVRSAPIPPEPDLSGRHATRHEDSNRLG